MKNSDLKKLSRPRRRALIASTAVVSLVITWLALEVFLRIFMPGARDLEQIVTQRPAGNSRAYSLKPGARVEFGGLIKPLERPVVWKINAQGIRSDRPLPPKSGKFRIAAFGDSEAFGWAVPVALTFQRRMELIDANIEVINLGTPGYNAENIADHMEDILGELDADLVIYLAHKNDTNQSLTYSPILAKSYVIIAVRYFYFRFYQFISKKKGGRFAPENFRYFADQVDRMADITRRRNVPLFIGFLDMRIPNAFQPLRGADFQTLFKTGSFDPGKAGFRMAMVDVENGWKKVPRIDSHMSPVGHQETADKFCLAISNGKRDSCTPPYWRAAGEQ